MRLKKKIQTLLRGGHRPDFIIVGAQKSGTSSLFSYLNESASLCGSTPKEIHFFDREDNFSKGNSWYEAHFLRRKGKGKHVSYFEASPSYLCREKVPARLKTYNPDLKIIIILREPIARAYSAWNMYRQWNEEGRVPGIIAKDQYGRDDSPIKRIFFNGSCPSFSDYIKLEMALIESGASDEEPSLLRRGFYKDQIERYVACFGWANVLVLGFNQLKNDSAAVVQRCHDFLGVPYQALAPQRLQDIKNSRAYPAEITRQELDLLEPLYAAANTALFEYLGFQPDW